MSSGWVTLTLGSTLYEYPLHFWCIPLLHPSLSFWWLWLLCIYNISGFMMNPELPYKSLLWPSSVNLWHLDLVSAFLTPGPAHHLRKTATCWVLLHVLLNSVVQMEHITRVLVLYNSCTGWFKPVLLKETNWIHCCEWKKKGPLHRHLAEPGFEELDIMALRKPVSALLKRNTEAPSIVLLCVSQS